MISVNHCPGVPSVIDAVASTNETGVGTMVKYTCKKGYRLGNGLDIQYIVCTTHAKWSDTPNDCTSKEEPI